ncbi:hypothetical protein H1R20_g10702, partial [Candolleomyces eurysporus]
MWNKISGPATSSLWLTDSDFDTAKDREYRYAAYEQPPTAEEKVAEEAKAGQLNDTLLNPDIDDFQLAIADVVSSDHRAFLNEYYKGSEALPKGFVNPKVKPQPHRDGGLMYAYPSLLGTYFTTTPQSAFVLGAKESTRMSSTTDVGFNVSFGGVVAHLERVPSHKEPFFTRTSGPTGAEVDQSVVGVRVSEYVVEQPPRVVGRHGQGLNGVTVREKVVLSPPHHERHLGNPERLGTKKYVSSRDDPIPINMRPKMFAQGSFWTTPNGQSHAVRTGKKGAPRVKDALSNLRRMAESVPESEGS